VRVTAAGLRQNITEERLAAIRLLLLDVDGVLTDGKIIYDDRGAEIKAFHVRDGLGIRLLIRAGIQVGIVTGRSSPALIHRCRDLGIDHLWDGVKDKGKVLPGILTDLSMAAEEVAFVGDDFPDLPIMRRVGLSIAPSDAHPLVQEHVHMITAAPGGNGAVREVCEAVLSAHNLLEKVLAWY
jgi:3-deoxy-D-manno-octulosonate 8-phosphate phosphatase (KDO 8-P phosphatase)